MIIYEEDVDEFLEHFGVRGQKWGVRRAKRNAAREARGEKPTLTGFSPRKELAIGVGIAAGSVLVANALKRHGTKKAALAAATKQRSSDEATKRLFQAAGGIKMNKINEAFRRGDINERQGWKLAGLSARQTRSKILRKTGGRLDVGLDAVFRSIPAERLTRR